MSFSDGLIFSEVLAIYNLLTPPGASAGRKSPKTFLTVDPRGRPYAKRHQKTLCRYKRVEFTVRWQAVSLYRKGMFSVGREENKQLVY